MAAYLGGIQSGSAQRCLELVMSVVGKRSHQRRHDLIVRRLIWIRYAVMRLLKMVQSRRAQTVPEQALPVNTVGYR